MAAGTALHTRAVWADRPTTIPQLIFSHNGAAPSSALVAMVICQIVDMNRIASPRARRYKPPSSRKHIDR